MDEETVIERPMNRHSYRMDFEGQFSVMDITRRNLILAAGVASLETVTAAAVGLPDKAEFTVGKSETCLNNARWHPIGTGATKAVQRYLEYKATGGGSAPDYGSDLQSRAKTLFANLIHSNVSELSFVPSTTVGENLIASALDLPRSGGNVVTDALHFEGSLYQYGELAKKGLEVRMARSREWRIAPRIRADDATRRSRKKT